MTREPEELGAAVADLSERLASEFAGYDREIVGGVVADLMATFIAGHVVVGDAAATQQIHRRVLQSQIDLIWELVDFHEQNPRKDLN